jgi:hypothetical protein
MLVEFCEDVGLSFSLFVTTQPQWKIYPSACLALALAWITLRIRDPVF